jgi:hypothetical protein
MSNRLAQLALRVKRHVPAAVTALNLSPSTCLVDWYTSSLRLVSFPRTQPNNAVRNRPSLGKVDFG